MKLSKKYKILILTSIVGLLGGYLYWRYVGCATGSCSITSNWHTSVLFGGLSGYFLGDWINDKQKKKQNQAESQ